MDVAEYLCNWFGCLNGKHAESMKTMRVSTKQTESRLSQLKKKLEKAEKDLEERYMKKLRKEVKVVACACETCSNLLRSLGQSIRLCNHQVGERGRAGRTLRRMFGLEGKREKTDSLLSSRSAETILLCVAAPRSPSSC